MDLANWTIFTNQSDTRALTGNMFFLAKVTRVLPETGVLGNESEAGESQPRSDELRLGVDVLRPEVPEGGLRLCLPTLRRFLSSENSSP